MTINVEPSADTTGNLNRWKICWDAVHSALPARSRQNAVDGDIRPDREVTEDWIASRNSSSSIPRFQPKKYSPKVNAPNAAIAIERTAAQKRCGLPIFLHDKSASAMPPKIRPVAEFGFIVARPSKTLFSAGISNAHPINPDAPRVTTSKLSRSTTQRTSLSRCKGRIEIGPSLSNNCNVKHT